MQISNLLRIAGGGLNRRLASRSSHFSLPSVSQLSLPGQTRLFTSETATTPSTSALPAEEVAKLSAFVARSGINCSQSRLLEALTHKSYRDHGADGSHERHQILGEKVLQFYVTEYLVMKYPALPGDAMESLIEAYTGPRVLASIGKTLGVQYAMRWKGNSNSSTGGEGVVVGKVLQALVGAMYLEKGPAAARQFIKSHVLSRSVDVASHLKLQNPKFLLSLIMQSQGKPRPVSRLLKETGRLSTAPVFIVGVYSGVEKIGEGYGSSLAMAETRAAKNAIEKHYIVEVKDITVPSDIDDLESRTSFLETSIDEGQ
ncbi:hypothetical protein HDU76_004846 [Blyttiomyces sp. JEL0837]|nr:hypothetical protein HDU76_004846 [Blyttiomyces sp. JEL0837]